MLAAATVSSMRNGADPAKRVFDIDFNSYCFRKLLNGQKGLDDPTGVKLRAIINIVNAAKIPVHPPR